MTLKPSISVIMPVYNCESFIRESVESILGQCYTDFEFIIIDDASTDRTIEIIKEYDDSRIQLIIKPANTGYTDSLNMAIKLAKGRYIARMDGDDVSLAHRLAVQYDFLEKNKDVLVVGSHYKIIGTDNIVRLPVSYEEVKITAIMHVPVAHPTVLIRMKVFNKLGLFYNKDYEPAEDYDLWCRILENGKIENVDEVLLEYRHHDKQESRIKYDRILKVAVQTRLSQVEKLINFSGKPYDILFAIDVLTKQLHQTNKPTLLRIRCLLNDLYEANSIKKVYDQKLLFAYLRERWMHHTNLYKFCHFKDISVLFSPRNYGVTKINAGYCRRKLALIFRMTPLNRAK